jgi:hypothetical protein
VILFRDRFSDRIQLCLLLGELIDSVLDLAERGDKDLSSGFTGVSLKADPSYRCDFKAGKVFLRLWDLLPRGSRCDALIRQYSIHLLQSILVVRLVVRSRDPLLEEFTYGGFTLY